MCVRYKARGAAVHVGHEVDKPRQHVKYITRQVHGYNARREQGI